MPFSVFPNINSHILRLAESADSYACSAEFTSYSAHAVVPTAIKLPVPMAAVAISVRNETNSASSPVRGVIYFLERLIASQLRIPANACVPIWGESRSVGLLISRQEMNHNRLEAQSREENFVFSLLVGDLEQ